MASGLGSPSGAIGSATFRLLNTYARRLLKFGSNRAVAPSSSTTTVACATNVILTTDARGGPRIKLAQMAGRYPASGVGCFPVVDVRLREERLELVHGPDEFRDVLAP